MHLPRASVANVVSCLALFVALGGASYAAVELPRNSVGAKQLVPGSIDNSKVKKGSLLRTAFKPGQLIAGRRGAAGLAGAQGPAGPAGAQGAPGAPGAIELAAVAPFSAQTLTVDGKWHTWTSVTFTAAANAIYEPLHDTGSSYVTATGSPGCTYERGSRAMINGAVIGTADDPSEVYAIPSYFGPYPAGTQVTFELQYQMLCATQTLHLPAGRILLRQYLAP